MKAGGENVISAAPAPCLAHALAYAARGWPVLPLAPGDKRPAGDLVPRGFNQATTDQAVIRAWFERMPGAGVGVHPGPAGLLVLDVDVKGGAAGLHELEAVQAQHGEIPATLTQRTPSGGMHLFLSLPAGCSVGNRKLSDGIDVRSAAGYVAAEPTQLGAGGYSFDDWDVLAGELPEIAPAPAWLLALLAGPGAAAGPAAANLPAPPHEYADARTVAELRSALNMLDADDYELWITCGHSLRALGAVGRELWITWSQQSAKWQPSDANRWHGFAAEHSGFRGVFARAQAAGWINPMSRAAAPAAMGPAAAAAPAAQPLRLVRIDDLDDADLPPQGWLWDGYIPAKSLTLLGAHGGTGKSMLALMLAVCVATGAPMLGVPTQAAPVLFYSAEDDADVVRRRLRTICAAWGVPAGLLASRLLVVDATHGAPELGAPAWEGEEGATRLTFSLTTAGANLRDMLAGAPGALLVVDNASDTFGGNENARPDVRAFVRLLVSLVRDGDGAVCLLAHIDKGAAKGFGGGENYSGSTAWHNSARSRLALVRDKDGGLMLSHEKCNYGRMREPLRLVWPTDGLPQLDTPLSPTVRAISTNNDTAALLRLLHEFTQRGESVTTATTSRTHAGAVMRLAPGFPVRLTNPQVFELLRNAERRGWLMRAAYRGDDRHQRERWEVTPTGCEVAGVAATAATAATTEVNAVGAAPASPCGDCGDFAGGVWGETAPQKVAAEVGG